MPDHDEPTEISEDLRRFLESVAPLTEAEHEELRLEAKKLENDPSFETAYYTSHFVENVLQTMKEEGVNKQELAKRLRCSKQRISHILKEDNRANFTVGTMIHMVMALNRRIDPPHFRKVNEATHLLRCKLPSAIVTPSAYSVNPITTEKASSQGNIVQFPSPYASIHDDYEPADVCKPDVAVSN